MATKKVTFPSANPVGDAQGVVCGDISSKKGLIVVHEWWGMTEQIQEQGERIAKEGSFLVFVPDMYRGKIATEREEAGHLMEGLDWHGALKDISAAANYLKSLGCTGVGVMGFCMGGALSFAAAVMCPEVSAVAPFYGIPKQNLADLTTARTPIQAHFGDKDEAKGFSSPADYEPLRAKLTNAGVPLEFHVYVAGHAFANFASTNYNQEAATLAMSRMYDFMNAKL